VDLYLLCSVLLVLRFCNVSLMFCLHYCKDCCHEMTSQLQSVIIIIIIIYESKYIHAAVINGDLFVVNHNGR
jgi:hypothetical protein